MTRLGGLSIAVALTLASVPARAHDHAVPKTALRARARSLQKGTIVRYCWVSKSEDGNVMLCADGLYRWKKAVRVRAGKRVRIRIHKRQRPQTLALLAWENVNPNDIPIGAPETLDYRIKRFRRDGDIVARDIVFIPTEPGRHYYVTAEGTWPDRNDPTLIQDALWTYHFRTRKEPG